jgi:hypothetical protein
MINGKRSLFVSILLVAGIAPASAETIHTGSDKGSYYNVFCPLVQSAIKKEYFNHSCGTSDGTADNIEKVKATPTDIGIGQMDLLADETELEIINPDIGMECMYAVTSDASITSLSGLSSRIPLVLPGEGSGSQKSFERLQGLDEGLASLRNITNASSAYEAVEKVVSGDAIMAFFVQFPDTRNEVFKLINDNELSFVPVISRNILRQEVNGQRLYEALEVNVTPQGLLSMLKREDAPKIQTSCTSIALFTGKADTLEGNAKSDQEAMIAALGNTQRPEKDGWKEMVDNAKTMGQGAIDDVLKRFEQ